MFAQSRDDGITGPITVESRTARFDGGFIGGARALADSALAAMSPVLIPRLVQAASAVREATTLALPAGVLVVSPEDSRRIQVRGMGGSVVFAVSPVVFSDDSSQAAVYVEHLCGGLCGSGRVIWLVRTATSRWEERADIAVWFS
ncbi:MAG TPA: hypothetical protein VFK13_07625 [Gemmatimonadaceae bacterium]|nr:hypothetical protein [Gemmatimonadaceae bacterium]